MNIFSRKKVVNLEEYCGQYYEKYFLKPVLGNIDMGNIIIETTWDSIVEVDTSFKKINIKKFAKEILILQFELFAVAWLHRFGDRSAIMQSAFTNDYLHQIKKTEIWKNAEEYNQAIARSSLAIPTKLQDKTALITIDKARFDLYRQYIKEGFDTDCVARALNRLFIKEAWEKTITENFLMITLTTRLGYSDLPNIEAQQRLAFTIRMIYDGAKNALGAIKIKN